MSMPVVQPAVSESTEERFRAVFGTHRTTFSSRPEDMLFPRDEDYKVALPMSFADTPNILHYLGIEDEDAPFLWVTDGVGRSAKHILYSASHNIWREDAAGQLTLLAPVL